MTDDWQWFWAGEGGRDRILRDEVEGLHAQLSSASSQTHRLSSQLASLSGSIETRLNALSEAFDAYVELGDVREELAAYEEPAAVRRSVMAAVDALAAGRPATPVDPRGLDYWLPYAMNAVIGLVEGRPDPAALQRARALSPETDTFVVAACGALGHGPAVADLLPSVLVSDAELTEHQQAIWRAAATGTFGDLGDGLTAFWRPAVDAEPPVAWAAWVDTHVASPADAIGWLRALVTTGDLSVPATGEPVAGSRNTGTPLGQLPPDGSAASEPVPQPDPTAGLRLVATGLIGRGLPAEAPLLERARELRARFQRPGSDGRVPRPPVDTSAQASATVVAEVQRALLLPSTSKSVRATLVSWVAPSLAAVTKRLTLTATRAHPAQETVRAAGAEIVVTPRGADPAEVESGVARLRAFHHRPSSGFVSSAVGGGVALAVTLVLAALGSGWAWLVGVVVVACTISAGQQLQQQRTSRREAEAAVERFREQVRDATERVARAEEQRSAALVRLTGEAAALTAQLPRPVESGDVRFGSGRQAGG